MDDLVKYLEKLKGLIREGINREIDDGGWYTYAICLDCLELVRYNVGYNAPDYDLEQMEKIREEVVENRIKHKGHTLIVLDWTPFECEKLCEYLLKKLKEVDSDGDQV